MGSEASVPPVFSSVDKMHLFYDVEQPKLKPILFDFIKKKMDDVIAADITSDNT